MGRCKRRSLRSILKTLDPSFDSTLTNVHSTLDLIKIADEQIDHYCERYPEQKKYLWPAFKILRPTDPFLNKEHRIYRNHCKELLIRIVAGHTTQLGTKAEVMLALSQMSLVAPPNQDHAALYFNLFDTIMGKRIVDCSNAGVYSYPGAGDEILLTMKKKLSQDWRK